MDQQLQLVQAQNDLVIYSLMLQTRAGGLDTYVTVSEQADG